MDTQTGEREPYLTGGQAFGQTLEALAREKDVSGAALSRFTKHDYRRLFKGEGPPLNRTEVEMLEFFLHADEDQAKRLFARSERWRREYVRTDLPDAHPFCRKLRELRLAAGMTAAEMGEKSKLDQETIEKYERGEICPSEEAAYYLLRFFHQEQKSRTFPGRAADMERKSADEFREMIAPYRDGFHGNGAAFQRERRERYQRWEDEDADGRDTSALQREWRAILSRAKLNLDCSPEKLLRDLIEATGHNITEMSEKLAMGSQGNLSNLLTEVPEGEEAPSWKRPVHSKSETVHRFSYLIGIDQLGLHKMFMETVQALYEKRLKKPEPFKKWCESQNVSDDMLSPPLVNLVVEYTKLNIGVGYRFAREKDAAQEMGLPDTYFSYANKRDYGKAPDDATLCNIAKALGMEAEDREYLRMLGFRQRGKHQTPCEVLAMLDIAPGQRLAALCEAYGTASTDALETVMLPEIQRKEGSTYSDKDQRYELFRKWKSGKKSPDATQLAAVSAKVFEREEKGRRQEFTGLLFDAFELAVPPEPAVNVNALNGHAMNGHTNGYVHRPRTEREARLFGRYGNGYAHARKAEQTAPDDGDSDGNGPSNPPAGRRV